MKKRIYEKPSMEAVELQQRTMLLIGSIKATRNGYSDMQEFTWGQEESGSEELNNEE